MNNQVNRKQTVFINFLRSIINDNSWKAKAEYSTNDNDIKVIVVQEQAGSKIVFFGEVDPLFNYYMIDIYGTSIEEEKTMSVILGNLIGKNHYIEQVRKENGKTYQEKWQIMIKQFSNFQPIEYLDIRRVGYNSTFQCVVNKVYEKEVE